MSLREEADDAIARNLMLFDRLAFELTGLHANVVRLKELGVLPDGALGSIAVPMTSRALPSSVSKTETVLRLAFAT